MKVSKGALVADVTPDSPADTAGIKTGDVVVKVDTTSITTAQDLTSVVGDHQPGDKVVVVVNRGGSEHTFQVTLATRPVS